MGGDGNPLARHGGVSYLEIAAPDPHRAAAFYREVLGWQLDPRGGDDIRFADPRGLFIGRFATNRAPVSDPGLLVYLYVDDLARALATATARGGALVKPRTVEGDVLVAHVRDPAGNLLGLWQFA